MESAKTATRVSKTPIRLNKFLADCGIASRRGADSLISSGKIQVNGKTTYELGVRIVPSDDRVTFDGKPVRPETQKIYVIFNKPENVLTSMNDPLERPTVANFMEELPVRVFPVGRLDWDTEGLLLLTNDGDFSQKVMHPREQIPKTYLAKLDGHPTEQQLRKLLTGVTIPGGKVKAVSVEKAKVGESKLYDWVKIVISEGKNRQVRHMFAKIGFDVKKLKRVAIGQLTLGGLQKGEYAFLDDISLAKIFRTYRSPEEREKARPRQKSTKKSLVRTSGRLIDPVDNGCDVRVNAVPVRAGATFTPAHHTRKSRLAVLNDEERTAAVALARVMAAGRFTRANHAIGGFTGIRGSADVLRNERHVDLHQLVWNS